MFRFQNRTDKLICENIFHSAKQNEKERFGFLHSKKTQNKNHQNNDNKKKNKKRMNCGPN